MITDVLQANIKLRRYLYMENKLQFNIGKKDKTLKHANTNAKPR